MQRAVAALAAMLAAFGLAAASASADNVVWGVNDDAGKYEQGNGPFWTTLRSVGMTSDTMTLHWDETTPTGFEGDEESLLAPALDGAQPQA